MNIFRLLYDPAKRFENINDRLWMDPAASLLAWGLQYQAGGALLMYDISMIISIRNILGIC